MNKIKSFPEIDRFVKLFVPRGAKSIENKWDIYVQKMFTQGYCYNFARIVQTAFQHKYKCAIVGRGVFDESTNYKKLAKNIADVNFAHFMCYVEHPNKPNYNCVYDICGAWSVNDNFDYKPLIFKEHQEKIRFLKDLGCLSEKEFSYKYPLDDYNGWKITWFLSSRESEHVYKIMLENKY